MAGCCKLQKSYKTESYCPFFKPNWHFDTNCCTSRPRLTHEPWIAATMGTRDCSILLNNFWASSQRLATSSLVVQDWKHTESKEKKKNQDKLLTFQLSILNLIHLTFFVKYVLVYLHFYTYKTNKTKSNTEYTTHIRDCESPQKPTCYLLQQGNSRVCLKWGQHFLKIYKARCLPTRQPTHATAETVCSPTHTKQQNYVISRVKHVVRTVTNLISL